MLTNLFKTTFSLGFGMTDRMIELLPEETREKVKSAQTSILEAMHEITGDRLNHGQRAEETGKPNQTKIDIE